MKGNSEEGYEAYEEEQGEEEQEKVIYEMEKG